MLHCSSAACFCSLTCFNVFAINSAMSVPDVGTLPKSPFRCQNVHFYAILSILRGDELGVTGYGKSERGKEERWQQKRNRLAKEIVPVDEEQREKKEGSRNDAREMHRAGRAERGRRGKKRKRKGRNPTQGVLRTATGSPIEQSSSPAQGEGKGKREN